jgi:hypothetical protein
VNTCGSSGSSRSSGRFAVVSTVQSRRARLVRVRPIEVGGQAYAGLCCENCCRKAVAVCCSLRTSATLRKAPPLPVACCWLTACRLLHGQARHPSSQPQRPVPYSCVFTLAVQLYSCIDCTRSYTRMCCRGAAAKRLRCTVRPDCQKQQIPASRRKG